MKAKVIVDIERMKYPFTGLHNYCENLYLNLLKTDDTNFDFHFFTDSSVKLPRTLKRIDRQFGDKLFLSKPNKFKLWHITYQDSRFVPSGNIKVVFTIHDLNFLYTNKPTHKKKKLLKRVQKTIDRADYVTVISNFVLTDVKKHLKLGATPIKVIHNGVNLKKFPNFDSPNYKPKRKFIFTLGTVLYKKHFHVLPQLIEGTNYELIIAGIQTDANYVEMIHKEIDKNNVKDQVTLTGPISEEEKYWYLKNCSAFVFPSISEGFGIPPIEAMQLGKPVFLSRFTSLPEIGGELAYYFTSFDKKEMQKTFLEGMKNFVLEEKEHAVMKWGNQFTWNKASAKYLEVYKKTLEIQKDNLVNTIVKSEQRKIKLTVIIPTLNEENNIEDAIKSVFFADEIIVIDSLSIDKTAIIAKDLGAKVLLKGFDDFSSQKNFAIDKATNNWVYILDADERVNESLKNEIINTLQSNPEEVAFVMKMNYYFMDRLMKYGSFQTKTVIRLFNKKFCKYDGKLVHEQFIVNGKQGVLETYLEHNSDKTLDKFIQTQNFYAGLKAQELLGKNDGFILLKILIKPFFRFIKHYLIQVGFLDGFQGFVFAAIQSYGVFIRYVKLWKLKKNKK